MVEVCDICGDRGFSNALLDCSECSSSAHQYCLGIPPGTIDDSFYWVCESCSVPIESDESCQFGGVFGLGSALQSCSGDLKIESKSEIVALPEQPKPLCMLSPIQYHGSSTRDNTSNFSQNHEAAISSFMEHPASIMRGIVLLVSPSGEVFVDKEKSSCESSSFSNLVGQILSTTRLSNKPATYKVKRELNPLGKTVEGYVDSRGTIESHDLEHQSLSEVDGFEESNDVPILSTSSKLDDVPFLSSMKDLRNGMLKRTVEPEVEVIQRKKATVHKNLQDAKASSSEPSGNLKGTNDLMKRQTDKCMMKFDRNKELSIGTALAQTKKSVRNQVVEMLLNAGWTIEYRPTIRQNIAHDDRVYVSPDGKGYWSVPRAYHKLERDFEKAKATKSELGDGSDNTNFCFKPLSKELLSVLNGRDRQFKKK